jgi:hypothetical protein
LTKELKVNGLEEVIYDWTKTPFITKIYVVDGDKECDGIIDGKQICKSGNGGELF